MIHVKRNWLFPHPASGAVPHRRLSMHGSVRRQPGLKPAADECCGAAPGTCRLPIRPATLAVTPAMKITRWISLACFAFLPLVSHAQVNDTVAADTVGADTVRALRVLPAPKEARLAKGRFVIEPSTTILIGNSEDRTAAETLQEEIQDRTGLKLSIKTLSINTPAAAQKTKGNISLGRLTDRG